MLVHGLQAMRESIDQLSRYHKEESVAQMRANAAYILKLQQRLEHCINPLNIVIGQIARTTVNVHKALELGNESLQMVQ